MKKEELTFDIYYVGLPELGNQRLTHEYFTDGDEALEICQCIAEDYDDDSDYVVLPNP